MPAFAMATDVSHILLRRWTISHKTRRIYRELGLQLRIRTPKRRGERQARAQTTTIATSFRHFDERLTNSGS
jgi:hypothetical protein